MAEKIRLIGMRWGGVQQSGRQREERTSQSKEIE